MFMLIVKIDNIKFAIWNLTNSEVMDFDKKGGGPIKAEQNEWPPSQLVVNAESNPSFSQGLLSIFIASPVHLPLGAIRSCQGDGIWKSLVISFCKLAG